jgi:putative transposase
MGSVVAGAVPSPGARSSARNAFPQPNHPAKISVMRGRLDHTLPDWIDPEALFFVTINARSRGINRFCNPATSAVIFEATRHYQDTQRWYCEILLLMPDHLHLLVSFPWNLDAAKVIGPWKQWLSRHHHIDWQENFFDHRVRRDESGEQKWHYILGNPVRAGLVERPGDWPWIWMPGRTAA